MLINLFRTEKASSFFSPAPKADSLVDKVLKLFMAIILAPVSAVKYSAGFVTSSFKKENPKTTSEKLAFAANTAVSQIKKAVESSENFVVKNQSTIIKVVIAAAVVTGAVYAYRLQTQPDDSRVPDGGGSFLGKVLFSGSLAGGALGIVYAATADLRADLAKTKTVAALNTAADVADAAAQKCRKFADSAAAAAAANDAFNEALDCLEPAKAKAEAIAISFNSRILINALSLAITEAGNNSFVVVANALEAAAAAARALAKAL